MAVQESEGIDGEIRALKVWIMIVLFVIRTVYMMWSDVVETKRKL